jgi:hypothetical protein
MINVSLGTSSRRYCDGFSRRQMIRLGSTGLLAGLNLPRLLQAQESSSSSRRAKATSCIFLFLEGGPPHQDMFDPKPDAPAEIRGPFKPISTKLPGILFSEHCKKTATINDKFTLIRSHTHSDGGHSTGYYYVMTGRKPTFPDGEHPIPTNDLFPSLGAFVGKELGSNGKIPAYINMPHPMSAGGPGFLGAEYAPFIIEADPSQPDFEVKDLGRIEGLSDGRFELRQKLLAGLEHERQRIGRAKAMSSYYAKAYDLITSPEARRAFHIQSEPTNVRESYGMTQIGQCALLGRRLVESGCRFVGIDAPGWDVHFNCFPSQQTDQIPRTSNSVACSTVRS